MPVEGEITALKPSQKCNKIEDVKFVFRKCIDDNLKRIMGSVIKYFLYQKYENITHYFYFLLEKVLNLMFLTASM